MNIYLDDMREAPEGWVRCLLIDEVKLHLKTGEVVSLSLDHDLGACADCYTAMGVATPEEWLDKADWEHMPNCEHFGTGYDLVCWMEETGHWPQEKPTVHSANPVGGKRMRDVIERNWPVVREWRRVNGNQDGWRWYQLSVEERINWIRKAYAED